LLWPDSTVHETDLFIPVDLVKIPEGLTIVGPPLKGLEIRIRAPKSVIKTVSDLKLRYPVDLSGINVGVNTFPIDKDRIPLPKEILIMRINPSFLSVRVENEIKKDVPVMISFSEKPAPGFFVADAVAKPSSVVLRGPESVLGPIEMVLTQPINVKGLSESFKKEIALDLAEDLDIISPFKIILAEIFIEEKIVTRMFNNILVEGKDTPYKYSITPPSINIEVKGPVNILEKLQTENGLKVYVDLKALTPGVYVRRAAISLPVKTTLVNASPAIFTVKLENRIRNPKVEKQKKE